MNIKGVYILTAFFSFLVWMNTGYESEPVQFRTCKVLQIAEPENCLCQYSYFSNNSIESSNPKINFGIIRNVWILDYFRTIKYNRQVGLYIVKAINHRISLHQEIVQFMSA